MMPKRLVWMGAMSCWCMNFGWGQQQLVGCEGWRGWMRCEGVVLVAEWFQMANEE